MLNINKALKLTSESEVVEQIDLRRRLGRQMIGQLYPSILMGEIHQLGELEWNLRVAAKKNVPVQQQPTNKGLPCQ